MPGLEEIKIATAEVIASYEERICAVEEIIERSLEMLDRAHQAKQMVHGRLKETLARVESLRKKDFDDLMAPLLDYQEKREGEIKSLLGDFLKKQRDLAGQLKRVIQSGILGKTAELELSIQTTIEAVRGRISSFQEEQTKIAAGLQCLSNRKENLTLKEFKKTLENLSKEVNIYGIRARDATLREAV